MKNILKLFAKAFIVLSAVVISTETCQAQSVVKVARNASRTLVQIPKVRVPRIGTNVYRGASGYNSGSRISAGANVHVNPIRVPSIKLKINNKSKYLAPLTQANDTIQVGLHIKASSSKTASTK